jgi:hypothetical protein
MLPSTLIGKEIIARPDAQVCRAPGIRRGNDIYVLVLVKGLWAGEGLAQSKSIKNTIVEQHPSRGNNNTTVAAIITLRKVTQVLIQDGLLKPINLITLIPLHRLPRRM